MAYILTGMSFPQQLVALRKAKGFTQTETAKLIGVSPPQYQRYESGKSQPTLDVICSIAKAFAVTSDALIFEEDERGPADDLKLQFEAISSFDEEEKSIIRALLESMIIRHESAKWHGKRPQGA